MIRMQIALAVALAAIAAPGMEMTLVSAPPAALAQEPELQDGDLLVGVHDGRGAIVRIRAGVATRYCISQDNHGERMYFDTPKEVVIDSRGDVVFLAFMSTPAAPASLGPYGLWRCSALGQPPELIAAFGTRPEFDHPRPLGDRPVKWAGGLHIKRAAGVDLDDGTASTTEWYVFVVANGGDAHRDTIAYNPSTGAWAEAGFMDDPLQPSPAAGYYQFDMINGGFAGDNYTVSAAGNAMKVISEPISIEFEIGGVGIAKLAFQSVRELVGAAVDDLTVPNADGHKCVADLPGTPRNVFGTVNGMSGIHQLAWPGRLLMQSDSFGMGHPFIPLANMILFNLDPFDDVDSLYLWPMDCSVRPKLLFTPWHPFNSYNDAAGIPRSADVIAPGGTAGTQRFDGRVIGIGPSQDVVVLASGLNAAPYVNPTGIDVYPGYQPSVAGVSLFIRIDSPVTVATTDAAGRRLGIDPATGEAVNDFGEGAFDSQTTEPHIYGIRRPADGDYRIEAVGTGTGPYHVTVFGVNHATRAVSRTTFSGDASPGAAATHVFAITAGGEVTGGDEPEPPVADSTPPLVSASVSAPPNLHGWHNSQLTVVWSVSDAESGIAHSLGCHDVTLADDTPGVTLTCTASNGAGLQASESVTVKLDRTAPAVSGTRMPAANAFGWNNSDVTVTFSCEDALSGVDETSVTGAATLSAEGANQSAAGSCVDRAGNQAHAVVDGINIDTTAPSVSCSANPPLLWPPNHRLMPIDVTVDVSDAGAGSGGLTLIGVTSNEGDVEADAQGWTRYAADTSGLLRSSRAGGGSGRIYALAYAATDRAGNAQTCSALVSAPHDRRR